MHDVLKTVTDRIIQRSLALRQAYLTRTQAARQHWLTRGSSRAGMGCANLAHSFAAAPANDKLALRAERVPNLGIVSAYNDMLSAHQPYADYPRQLKEAARLVGAVAQVAGGVPAMCDGITQGEAGMDLSLFSRDVIAQATAIALSHSVFDAVACLGVCDKIVPGLLMGALQFGHLPCVFVPAGPMTSGLGNDEKSKIRQLYAQGKVGREALLQAESEAYHGVGTCTFYGTANSNQMLMEIMGLHLPGSSFVNPGSPLREALTRQAVAQALKPHAPTLASVVDERSIVNGVVGLLATGGSTNHTLHLVAMARAAGVWLTWDDFDDLSKIVPLLCRIYPNGRADVNHFHAAGGMGFVMRELLSGGLLHGDVSTVMGQGLAAYVQEPWLNEGVLSWRAAPAQSADESVLRGVAQPFDAQGGLRLLAGNLGRGVTKISAVRPEHQVVQAPALVVNDQHDLLDLYAAGALQRDFIAVLRYQGPKACGMPELHKLMPALGALQDQGFKVALVTDGRLSGASGKVPAAIHLCPEALAGGALALLQTGDLLRLDCASGELLCLTDLSQRNAAVPDLSANATGCGRELFGSMRASVSSAEQGACSLFV
jgi:phosphogluconate dehydratase